MISTYFPRLWLHRVSLTQSFLVVLGSLSAAFLLLSLLTMIVLVTIFGARHFLPMNAYQVVHQFDTQGVLFKQLEQTSDGSQSRFILSYDTAERVQAQIEKQSQVHTRVTSPAGLMVITTNNGEQMVGTFVSLRYGETSSQQIEQIKRAQNMTQQLLANRLDIQVNRLVPLHKEIHQISIQRNEINDLQRLEQLKLQVNYWQSHVDVISDQINQYTIVVEIDNQQQIEIKVSDLKYFYQPNQLSKREKFLHVVKRLTEFITQKPNQSGDGGGVFPALFGTFLMVIFMAIAVTPFGAIVAIYLHEYAPQNKITSIIRVCISNMAAVPSVVYGVFGLGFFVYGLGGSIDSLFFSDSLPAPTFGAPGLLWASLTMGLLTLPVVIVSTEEGLSRVPDSLRLGPLALGATKYETIRKVVLPIASPGILTGVILAIARAAGEVAPLMLVGAVKYAPTLPIDGQFPFVHLERQFMHLGVFIYDGAFSYSSDSSASSIMFASCMLLLVIVFLLNISAVMLRGTLRKRYGNV